MPELQGELDLAAEACLKALRGCAPYIHAGRSTSGRNADVALDPETQHELAEQIYMLVGDFWYTPAYHLNEEPRGAAAFESVNDT